MTRTRWCAAVVAALMLPPVLLSGLVAAPPSASAATAISAQLLGPLVNVLPLDQPAGSSSLATQAQPGELESFQVAVRPTEDALSGVSVAVSAFAGPGGATIGGNDVTVFREAYTRVWTPSDQEGWCPYFTEGAGPSFTCGVPAMETADGSWINTSWKCGGATAPAVDARRCLFPDALVPERDAFYGEDRNAFPMTVPAGENRMAWVDVNVPASAPAGTYSSTVTVSAAGRPDVLLPVSLTVRGPALPAPGTDPVVGLDGGVNVNPELCNAHDCPDNATKFRLMYLYTRASLENRMPILNPALNSSPYGNVSTLFDTWVRPLIKGTVGPLTDGLTASRQPGSRVPLVALNQHYGPEDWSTWQGYARANGFAGRMRFYCDEVPSKTLFQDNCASPYDAAVGAGGWDLSQNDLPSVLIGEQAQENAAHTWGHYAVLDHEKTRIPIINRLQPKGGSSTRGQYDAPGGFLAGRPDRSLWTYNSNASLGSGTPWTPHEFWNGWPVLGGVDQPPVSELASAVTAWMYRTTGHYYYDAFNRLAQAWNDCSTGAGCLYTDFGGHGDGTLYYPGTTARIGGTHPIPVESMRLKRYRDGAETYSLLRMLETGCDGACPGVSRAQLAEIIGNPDTGTGLFTRASATDVSPAAYSTARDDLLALLPADGPAGPATVSIGDASVVEGDGPERPVLVFPVTRTGDLSQPSSARFTMVYDTARDSDAGYPFSLSEDTPDHVHFAAGAATAEVRSVVFPDDLVETDETVTMTLSEPDGAQLGDATAHGTIVDDDSAAPAPRRAADSSLRKGDGSWHGAGVVNCTGEGQSLSARVSRRHTVTFTVRIRNTGTGRDSFSLADVQSGKRLQVSYRAASRDITDSVRNGLWSTGALAPGAARRVSVTVRVPADTPVGTTRRVLVHAVSERAETDTRDVVALRVRAKR